MHDEKKKPFPKAHESFHMKTKTVFPLGKSEIYLVTLKLP